MAKKKLSNSPRSPIVTHAKQAPKSRTVCPVSLKEFLAAAENLPVLIGRGHAVAATPKEFTTGRFGWSHSSKGGIMLGEVIVPVQITVTLTAINSNGKAG